MGVDLHRLVRLLGLLAVGISQVVSGEFFCRGEGNNAPGVLVRSRINKEALLGLEPLIFHESIHELHLGIGVTGFNPIQSLNQLT